ncbi:MAG: prephenate dehydratase [Lachnospiraceae bacterium]|nr:prephenate dehydratase [Lachnospiraceae bacterium]
MRDLQEIRPEIDRIDKELVRMFEERMKLCEEVAEFKVNTGKKVFDPEREEEKLKALCAMADTEFNEQCIGELFTQMMCMSRKLQYQKLAANGEQTEHGFTEVEGIRRENIIVAYQGVEGAYSHQAMLQYFGKDVKNFHVKTFREAMEVIRDGKADYAVLPIENSSAGSVNDVYDLLLEFENCIVAETFVRAEHALLGLPEASMEDIKTVYSHPQALMQCSRFLEQHREWQSISELNTAVSAKKVVEAGDKSQAAIASTLAAELYGLKVLQTGINHNRNNTTRFLIVSRDKIYTRQAKKVSISFELLHTSGTLYNMISHFIFNHLNMTKIESRPIEGRNWEYRFVIDVEGRLSDADMKNALLGIREEAKSFKILGNY